MQAEEILTDAQTAALGAGTLSREATEKINRGLQQQAGITRKGPSLAALASVGVAVEVVKKHG